MSSTETYVPALGDLVTVDPMAAPKGTEGKVYRVKRVPAAANQRNYTIDPVDGRGTGLRAPAYYLRKHEGPAPAAAELVDLPRIAEGVLVRFTSPSKDAQRGVFVVIKQQPSGDVNVVRVGGHPEGRYFRSIPASRLTVVEVPEELSR